MPRRVGEADIEEKGWVLAFSPGGGKAIIGGGGGERGEGGDSGLRVPHGWRGRWFWL